MKYKVRSFFSYFLHLYLLLWLHTIHVQAANTAKWVTGTNLHARAGSVSRDGKILAYVRDKESSSEMWIKYLNDTGGGVKIFEATGTIELPHWSPGRKFLVFGVKDDGMGRIYRKNLATNDPPIALTKAGINCFHPTISPDESQIAYDSDESGNFDIWTMNLKTFEKRQITNYRNHDFYPTFSPDGKSLAYTSFRNETFHLFLKDLTINGSRPVQLTQGEMISAHPAFSLDGQGIYFDSNLNGENQIFFLNLHNYSMYQVTEGELKAKYPVMGSGVLVFEAEEAGVRGVRMLSLNEKARNRWKKESPPVEFEDSQPQPVQAQLVNDSEDFEKDLSLIRIEKDQLIKNPALPTTQFEEADFNLNFTQKEPGQEGILVGHGEATKSPFSPARASTERTYPTPLQKLRDTMAIGPEIVSNRVDPVIQSREFPAILNSKVEAKKHETGESRVLEEFYQPRIPEAVRATLPANGTRSVALFHPISLIFKRELQKGEEGYLQAKIYADGREIPVQSHYQKSHQRIDLIPQESLQPGTQYRVIAGQAAFEFSTEGAKLQLSSTGKKGSIRPVMNAPREARSFKIARVFPRHQSRNNKVHAPIRIRFSSEIDPDTIHASTVAIYMDDQLIPGELTFETNDRELSLKPYRNLQEAGVYEVRIDSTLRSKNGSQLEGPKNWKFKTEHYEMVLKAGDMERIMPKLA
ncbi:hypothetical protein HOF92_08905, partial [bacterium]|nr:hypothetical protein [bacterium]